MSPDCCCRGLLGLIGRKMLTDHALGVGLGVGIGVGLGVGLGSGHWLSQKSEHVSAAEHSRGPDLRASNPRNL